MLKTDYLNRPPEIDCLVRFSWDIPYGCLESIFLGNEESLKQYHNFQIYFGEVAGKHSDIYGHLNICDFYIMSRDPKVLDALYPLVGEDNHLCGINVFDYVDQDTLAEHIANKAQ